MNDIIDSNRNGTGNATSGIACLLSTNQPLTIRRISKINAVDRVVIITREIIENGGRLNISRLCSGNDFYFQSTC